MKKNKLTILILVVSFFPINYVSSQFVSFDKDVYNINEEVTGSLKVNVIGIHSELLKQSLPPTTDLKFRIPGSDSAGYYRVDFYFSTTNIETHYVLVLPSNEGKKSNEVYKTKKLKNKYVDLTQALIKYNKDGKDFSKMLSLATGEYFKSHAVDVGLTVVVCISVPLTSAGAPILSPVFFAACKAQFIGSAKDLSLEFLKAAVEVLYTDGYLNKETYNTLKQDLKVLDFSMSFIGAENRISAIAAIFKLVANQDQVSLGIDYGDQTYKKFSIILDILEKSPK